MNCFAMLCVGMLEGDAKNIRFPTSPRCRQSPEKTDPTEFATSLPLILPPRALFLPPLASLSIAFHRPAIDKWTTRNLIAPLLFEALVLCLDHSLSQDAVFCNGVYFAL